MRGERKVALAGCADYDEERVKKAVATSVGHLGGMSRFIAKGDRVLVKPNILMSAPPDKAVTTHPAVLKAVVELVQQAGGEVTIADSAGMGDPYTEKSLGKLYDVVGYTKVAEETGANLNLDTAVRVKPAPDGHLQKRFEVIGPAIDADKIVSVSKLKTHTLMHQTGAVKNMYGLVAGRRKVGLHSTLPDPDSFADMLLDLTLAIPAALHVMDGVVGMEGDGPNAGTPRTIGVILASENPVSLDMVVARIMDIHPSQVPSLSRAFARNLHPSDPAGIDVAGDPIEGFVQKGFASPSTYADGTYTGAFVDRFAPFLKSVLTRRPVPKDDRCVGCGICIEGCPRDAIVLDDNKKAKVTYGACIRCYCCHELCPHHAIDLEYSAAGKVARRFLNI